MLYVMEVPAVHQVRVEPQMRFPNADPTVVHEPWRPADLVNAQAQVDPFYAQGIRALQRIDSRIAMIAANPALDKVRAGLERRAERIRTILREHLGIPSVQTRLEEAAP